MKKENTFEFPNEKAEDLIVANCGICATEPLDSYGPAVKPYYLIVYVLEGNGLFTYTPAKKKYPIEKGSGFLIAPEDLASFQSDKRRPWTYAYIGFTGHMADKLVRRLGLSDKSPIFKLDNIDGIRKIVTEMMDNNTFDLGSELKRNGLLKVFLSYVANSTQANTKSELDRTTHYVYKAVEYMKNNYCNPIKITEVAEYVTINRSYLYTLFMNTIAVSPHQFLANYRIDRACELLATTKSSIESVALSCGYMDSLVFTKAFKQMKGISPSNYRKNAQSC